MPSFFLGNYEKTDFGATLHRMNEELESGDIIDHITFENDGIIDAEEAQKSQKICCFFCSKKI
tara:strand:+ start:624 stop:812 length:189 start_codon:yes stop_codon:yes gene_type:complete